MNDLVLDPVPSILIESLRDIGYRFDTAIADVVDNSLSANAERIWIEGRTEPFPAIAIIDDGDGLSRSDLLDSMRMGSRDPKLTRAADDLGRFGLGLKTASFSQCRKLTVVSVRKGQTSGFTWDLDKVVESNEWRLIELADFSGLPYAEMLPEHGTMVVWEKLDRVLGEESDAVKRNLILSRYLENASNHLSLVFHRFLARDRGHKPIKFILNGGLITPLDPFVTNNSATIAGPVEPMGSGVTVQSFTLPHSSKYKRRSDYEANGLPGGYIKNQGIYLYRARRLIIHGTWFGLAKKTTLTQLCRVKIDIDNSHDEEWKIDVKKASAQLPEAVRTEVRNLLERFKSPSVGVYRRRGTKQVSNAVYPVWNTHTNGEKVSFKVNRSHPVVQEYLSQLPSHQQESFSLVLRLIESEFPKDAFFYEVHRNSENVETPTMSREETLAIAKAFFTKLESSGQDDKHILDVMSSVDMFSEHWNDILNGLGIEEGEDA